LRQNCGEERAPCFLIASGGALALLSLLDVDRVLVLSYVIFTISLGLSTHFIRNYSYKIIIYILSIILILLQFSYNILISLSIFYLITIILIYLSNDIKSGLSFLQAIILIAYSYGGDSWARVFSGLVILLSSLVSYMESKRGHSLMLTAVSPLVFLFSPLVDVAASLSSIALAVVLAEIVEKSSCPFTKDSGMVFAGVSLSVIGVLFGIVGVNFWLPIWLTGFLYLEAGVLVPLRIGSR